MLSKLSNTLNERKDKLTTYLNNNNDELTLEKQHQIYGAITELEQILDVLRSHKKNEINQEKNSDEIFLFKPIHSKGVIKDVATFLRDLF